MEVLFLDDDDDLRDAMADLLESFGHTCIGLATCDELMRLGAAVARVPLALLDINLGPDTRSGIDAYRWLREQGFTGQIVFLTGHAGNHPLVRGAISLGHARVLQKPVSVGVLNELFSAAEAP